MIIQLKTWIGAFGLCIVLGMLCSCHFDSSGLPLAEEVVGTFSGRARIERPIRLSRVPYAPPLVLTWSCASLGAGDLSSDGIANDDDGKIAVDKLVEKFMDDQILCNRSSATVTDSDAHLVWRPESSPGDQSVLPKHLSPPFPTLPWMGGYSGSVVEMKNSSNVSDNMFKMDLTIKTSDGKAHYVRGQTGLDQGTVEFYLERLTTSIPPGPPEENLWVTGLRFRAKEFDALVDGGKLHVSSISLVSYMPFRMSSNKPSASILSGPTTWSFYQKQPSPLFLSMYVQEIGWVRQHLDVSFPYQFTMNYTAGANVTSPAPFEANLLFTPKDIKAKGSGQLELHFTGIWKNRAPVADAGPDATETCLNDGVANVALNGLGSKEFDPQQALQYMWIKGYNDANAEELLEMQAVVTVSLPVGSHVISLLVWDSDWAMSRDDKSVTVVPKPPGVDVHVKPPNVQVSQSLFGKLQSFDWTISKQAYCLPISKLTFTVCGDKPPLSQYGGDPSQDYDVQINGTAFHKQQCGSLDVLNSQITSLKLRMRYDGPTPNTFKYRIELRAEDTAGAVNTATQYVTMTKYP